MIPCTKRPAIAMIELIFALVVIGFALFSAPMLVQVASKSTSIALQQEGINEAAARINMILTYAWDENDTNGSYVSPILRVTDGDTELEPVDINSTLRIGVPNVAGHASRKFGDLNATLSLGAESGETSKDDVDDFIGSTTLTLQSSGSGGTDYIETDTVSMTTQVVYIGDEAVYGSQTINFSPGAALTSGSSNIKRITVTLTSTSNVEELNKTIVMHAFTTNIGGYVYDYK